uniref:Response regulatory domain-containing protein n=1 Tax=Chromera velia CCMP2878 TaxID=1169474 RepID=A0A0G4G4W2_9ALVE|eukprot:Cvel_20277.t1-p1 / transcript=Cvel_20277.t1 / gene=Cvel_20277 / organism=Chromera_velia_CCMP2878 / gene_product=hypothetical protein / transcript_product=hypothetical protein / location=Cvel_scaffold1809:15505-15879(+) / protein_length=125 / sequence_SO=supercontig / SO=protein_coding / is_pseudo=false
MALKRLGLSVEVSEDGSDAVARFQEKGERYRLVLIDRNMPNLEGPPAITTIQNFLKEETEGHQEENAGLSSKSSTVTVPVFIGLTGQTEAAEDFHTAGAADVLFKPVTQKVLRATLEKLRFLTIE